MKKGYKIALIAVGICIALSALMSGGEALILFLFLGAISMVASFICLIIGLASSEPETKKGFLITSGLLLLLGVGICGPMLMAA